MFTDIEAVQKLNRSIQGRSVHRRGLVGLSGKFVDCHVRIPNYLLGGERFPTDYCQQLGIEMSQLDAKLFQDFLLKLFTSVADDAIMGNGRSARSDQIYLVLPSSDGRLFSALRSCLFSVVVGNMMSKSLH